MLMSTVEDLYLFGDNLKKKPRASTAVLAAKGFANTIYENEK